MNKLRIIALCSVLLALAACSDNLFGSSSSGNCAETNNECLRIDAENAFRSGKYGEAYKLYSQIVKNDSTASVGYFGMAKAGLWRDSINPFDVLRYVKVDENEIPFIKEEAFMQNRYYQGMRRAANSLSILQRRDSLTALYERHLQNPSRNDSLQNFRDTFCGGSASTKDCADTSGAKSLFPLSDMEFRFNSFGGALFVSTAAKTLLGIFDINKDSCITKRGARKGIDNPGDPTNDSLEWKKWGCSRINGKFSTDLSIGISKGDDGNFFIELNKITDEINEIMESYYEIQKDPRCSTIENANKPENQDYCAIPPELSNINDRMDEFASGLSEILDILNSFEINTTDGEKSTSEWQNEIDNYKGYASFYKIGTHIDEDGDGCIDEELLDGMDNDGDGLSNENTRIAQADIDSPRWGFDNMMGFHSMSGDAELDKPIRLLAPVKICANSNCSQFNLLLPPEPDQDGYQSDSITVLKFTQESGYWISNNIEDKLSVAQDTTCPPKIKLAARQRLIGGCWRWYDDNKFVEYWLKRKLASPIDQINRVHYSCKVCNGVQCLIDQ
jgi:hypothetical protein